MQRTRRSDIGESDAVKRSKKVGNVRRCRGINRVVSVGEPSAAADTTQHGSDVFLTGKTGWASWFFSNDSPLRAFNGSRYGRNNRYSAHRSRRCHDCGLRTLLGKQRIIRLCRLSLDISGLVGERKTQENRGCHDQHGHARSVRNPSSLSKSESHECIASVLHLNSVRNKDSCNSISRRSQSARDPFAKAPRYRLHHGL